MNTNKNLPRVLYFAIQNPQGKIVYTLQRHKKYFLKVAIDIPDNFLTQPSDDSNYSIIWSINDEVIQHDDIPILLMKQENKHISLLTCEVTADEEKMIYLNLSLHAAHAGISPKSQLKTFSFFKTIIRSIPQVEYHTDTVGIRKIPTGNKATKEELARSTSNSIESHSKDKRD